MQNRYMSFSKGRRFGRCEGLQGAKNLGLLPKIAFENEILRRFAPQNDID